MRDGEQTADPAPDGCDGRCGGLYEPDEADPDGDEASDDETPKDAGKGVDDEGTDEGRAPPIGGEWPALAIDVSVLADPDTDPVSHRAEWRRVFETFDPYLRYHFERQQLSYAEAQDVIGELWYRAMRKIRTLTDPPSLVFWLIKIGRNVLLDRLKAENRRLERERRYVDGQAAGDGDWRDAVLDTLSAEQLFDDRIDRREFRRHFAMLSDMDQEFAIMLKVEGYSHRELMAHFGLTSEDASKSRWQWIRRKLIKALGATVAPCRKLGGARERSGG